jgi:hypothetical protein
MRAFWLIFFSILTLAAAGNKPNFSGVWKLNPAKSEFGKAPAPQSLISTVEHHDPELKVHSETTGAQGTSIRSAGTRFARQSCGTEKSWPLTPRLQ